MRARVFALSRGGASRLPERLSAKLDVGVLTLTITKRAEAKPRKIPLQK